MKGKIIEWHDAKGYGFISASEVKLRVFFHVSQLRRIKRRPGVGDNVDFELTKDIKGRLNATSVRVLNPRETPATVIFALSFLILTAGSLIIFNGPLWLLPVYLVLSVLTFGVTHWISERHNVGAVGCQRIPCICLLYWVVGQGHSMHNHACAIKR
ncbi:cold shock domain-containing protein [Gilvimarinus agarilyticus]|uniref:cold shock domain-containing protein n=1 Tax=Gilvimarinus sp. 2_MG-2023 TaxID=3062666 RepID=UPI001C09024B|nr:cold shock domain-containing protein [Gilvimarinus sp. 2_MG-2023]MBU2886200.1 cold shock domain-containing protein [Gilvimarinus agarilyticus]MDO6570888.1 cold shock domain-containing protein [Gilvimarinus sp. 2_MG-2023]